MAYIRYLVVVGFLLFDLSRIEAHGRLMDPVNRGSAFRKGFPTPENWDDDGNYCGGYVLHYIENGGKCGVCGDNWADKQPRSNENGGKYGKGVIVEKYKAGSVVLANVTLTANHLGYFTFDLCPLKNSADRETDECFADHRVELARGGYRHPIEDPRTGDFLVELRLPERLTCKHCVLRWQYTAGNSWGLCANGTAALGCGEQETFRTCSDITIE